MYYYLIIILSIVKCDAAFSQGQVVATVTSHHIEEASGVAASRTHPGVLYTHNDHGDGPNIYVIDSVTGHRISTITVNGAHNSDWEDIAYGPCDAGYCLYVGDTGDAGAKNIIYMIREPASVQSNQHVDVYKQLHFSWSEIDCETLLVDPRGEIYIISKVKNQAAKAAHVPSSAWNSGTTVALTNIVSLSFHTANNDPTGGDISPNGQELLLVSHHKMFYWNIPNGDVLTALQSDPIEVPYHDEPQGEAVCWDAKGQGYFTLSEGKNQPLYYYGRS
ncbi:uncharacterized protein LOC134690321 [Mytilus trossulus]|uniref:uncharacterized protein LOC134690321 n=1 Tax=Mytilus trossulus TaxID=6551 RepID=UPI003005037B